MTYSSVLTGLFVILNLFLQAQNKSDTSAFNYALERITVLIDNFELEKAHKLCDSLENISVSDPRSFGLANIYNTKGIIYKEENNLKEAITYFSKAIDVNEKNKAFKQLAQNYVNLGSMYSFLNERKTALNYYFKAVNLFKTLKNKEGLSILYNNIGNTYLDNQEMVSAEYYFRMSLNLSLNIHDTLNVARVYHNLGNCMTVLNRPDSALQYYFNSLQFLGKYAEGFGHMYNYIRIANIYIYNKKEYSKGEEYTRKGLKLAEETGSLSDILAAYSQLTTIYETRGDLKNALIYSKKYATLKDSLNNEEDRSVIVRAQYETELRNQKKEQELIRTNEEAISKARIESKNKDLLLSYSALGFAIIMALFILNGYRQKQKANKIISKQKEEVEHKNEEILASINYAKRIQYALLAHKEFIDGHLPNNFIYFDPKDIVSGDFYWATEHNNKFYLAVCDSTGHGVPGAFMSLLNIGFLTEAINEKDIIEPCKVFDHVRKRLIESISKEGQKDGFDGILICIDKTTNEITYAAANNAPLLVSNGAYTELPKDKMPVGIGERNQPFTLFSIKPNKGDSLFLYTDGFADQFGGPHGKKYKYKPLNQLLLNNVGSSMDSQRSALVSEFKNWKGSLEQVDDVLVIGIKF